MKASGVIVSLALVAGGLFAVGRLGVSETSRFMFSQPQQGEDAPQRTSRVAAKAPVPAESSQTAPVASATAPTSPVPSSNASTPTAQAPAPVVPAPPAPENPAGTSSGTAATVPAGPKVDLTALRYFAMRGDTRRLEAEIARLRALYPTWTPPADPLATAPQGDAKLDAMWKLYSEGKIAEVREAIAQRQADEPQWVVPEDLLARLAASEAREQLVNASNLKQYDTVVRVAADNSSLLTCGDVDVLWRVAEAFALTERQNRAKDAYLYILDNCENATERLATVQKALPLLARADLDTLLSKERTSADGKGEFAPIRLDISRQTVAGGSADAKVVVPAADLKAVEAVAESEGLVSDELMLGWYYIQREQAEAAEKWFARAYEEENTAQSAQGLALALVDLDRPAEAEDILYQWRDTNEEVMAVYLAAVTNMLAADPIAPISEPVLARLVPVVYDRKDPDAAQQLGWYADAMNQFETAAQWFATVLRWKPSDEPSAYGLALMNWKLGNQPMVERVQREWAGRSDRIAHVGEPEAGSPREIDDRNLETSALPRRSKTLKPESLSPYATAPRSAAPKAVIPRADDPDRPARTTVDPISADPNRFAPDTVAPAQPKRRTDVQAYVEPERRVASKAARVAKAYVEPVSREPKGRRVLAARYDAAPEPEAVMHRAVARETTEPSVTRVAARNSSTAAAPATNASTGRSAGCTKTMDPGRLAPDAALSRGWCLMDLNRPVEAAAAFQVALGSNSSKTRENAAYGQSLAYLRAGLADHAAVAATKAPLDRAKSAELQTALLSRQAGDAFDRGRYTETIMALDQLARVAPERIDLMVLRGYAYMNLRRYHDALRTFHAAAGTGSRDALRGIAIVEQRMDWDRGD